MGIQSTRKVTRGFAIERIKKVARLLNERNYRAVELASFEPDLDIEASIDCWMPINIDDIDNWTDKMLESLMNRTFFRLSMFENYEIEQTQKGA